MGWTEEREVENFNEEENFISILFVPSRCMLCLQSEL